MRINDFVLILVEQRLRIPYKVGIKRQLAAGLTTRVDVLRKSALLGAVVGVHAAGAHLLEDELEERGLAPSAEGFYGYIVGS